MRQLVRLEQTRRPGPFFLAPDPQQKTGFGTAEIDLMLKFESFLF
jgi:hypothetical protein